MSLTDDLALAQTIILNAGKGYEFSNKLTDRLKRLMISWNMERLCCRGYAAVLDGNDLRFEKVGV